MSGVRAAALVLRDGEVFEGEAIGAEVAISAGEVVFHTGMSGYQEIVTDPSYAGQIVTFTYPHIGNYGVTAEDEESARPACRAVVVRELARRRSSWRAEEDLDGYLRRHGLAGIGGVDTRRLTRHLRDVGATVGALGTASVAELLAAAAAEPGTDGVDLVAGVSTAAPYVIEGGPWRIVAVDYGMKRNIVRLLSEMATVEVVPASTPAEAILEREPDGVFLSNGPGDPAAVSGAADTVARLATTVPTFGICLGHQILALALGGEITKLAFGHHGANHPVRDVRTNKVAVTSQNHNFAVVDASVPDTDVTHVNLNDGTVEGLRHRELPVMSVQHHPEAAPGPHDARPIFDDFVDMLVAVHGPRS